MNAAAQRPVPRLQVSPVFTQSLFIVHDGTHARALPAFDGSEGRQW